MNRIILILFFAAWGALQPCNATVVNYSDTSTCIVKNFDAKRLAAYQGNPEFSYETTNAKEGGPFELLAFLFASFLEHLNRVRMGSISLYDVIFYGIMFFAAVMIVLQFFKIKISGLFAPGSTDITGHQSFTENVHQLDFDTLITEARNSANFRLATRLYYLKTLKRLSDAGLINWQKNKTNFEYYYELKGDERRRQFYDLTRLFESVWYGNLELTEAAFDENLKTFTGFLQNLKR